MASRPGGAIYIGRTGNLGARQAIGPTHGKVQDPNTGLVRHDDFSAATNAIKRWPRAWKNALIAERNPNSGHHGAYPDRTGNRQRQDQPEVPGQARRVFPFDAYRSRT
jgi:putative endonuclease